MNPNTKITERLKPNTKVLEEELPIITQKPLSGHGQSCQAEPKFKYDNRES